MAALSETDPLTTIPLNGTWRFFPEGCAPSTIEVPSHWTHGTAWGYPDAWASVERAAYEREVEIPDLAAGASAWLRFDAVMLKARVLMGGEEIGRHAGGFTPFELEVSAWAGRSATLRVEVEGAPSAYSEHGIEHPVSYPKDKEEGPLPGGIWQPVRLITRPPVFLREHHIETSVREGALRISLDLESRLDASRAVRVRFFNADSSAPEPFCLLDETANLTPASRTLVTGRAALNGLTLWSPQNPRLHTGMLQVEEVGDGPLIFQKTIRFGLREFHIEGRDFFLNGKKTHLLGTSLVRHRISPHLWRRDYLHLLFTEFKKLGINCLRTHGSLCPEVVLDTADECGLMIQNQSALWSNAIFGYRAAGEVFLDNAKREFRDWFRRDRNHPSVVLWDVENEQVRILPEAAPMIAALVDTLREAGTREPILASGASGFDIGDVYHLHCGPNPTAIIRRWTDGAFDRPFIHGEWWADQTRMHSRTYLLDGMPGKTRVPLDFENASDVLKAAGYLYAEEFIANRLQDVSGSTAFSFETLCFDPIFNPGEELKLPRSEDESVDFFQPDHFEGEGLHVLRRPLVNPGWAPDKPRVRLNPHFIPYIRKALTPFLVGFREESRHADPDGRIHRTLVFVNDSESTLAGSLRLRFGDRSDAFDETKFELAAGAVDSRLIDVAFPTDASADQPLEIRAEWTSCAGEGSRVIARITPPVNQTDGAILTDVPVAASGLTPTMGAWLRRHCPDFAQIEPTEVPSADAVWIIGPGAAPDAGDAADFLKQGGRALLLRRESPCAFLPAVVEHVSSLRAASPIDRPWGFDAVGRERSAIIELPVIDPEHPVMEGLVPHPTPACPHGALLHWNADGGGLADDVLGLPAPSESPASGHLRSILGAKAIDQSTLAEWRSGTSRLLFCQLRLDANLAATPEAAQLLGNLVRYLARRPAPSASFSYSAEEGMPPTPDWLPAVPEATTGSGLRIIQTSDLATVLHHAEDATSDLGTFLHEGGRLLVIPPIDRSFVNGPILPFSDETPRITSVPHRRESLLAGLSPAFWEAFAGGGSLLALPPEGGGEALIRIHRTPPTSPAAGLQVSPPLAALWTKRQIGNGELHLCAADFGGEPLRCRNFLAAVLGNAGVDSTMPPIRPPEVHRFDIFHTRRPIPLDGDLDKWTNTEADDNIAPWSRSQRALLTPCEDPQFPRILELFRQNRCAALGYALWDERHLYAAILCIAPAFNPAPRKANLWDYTACQLQIGFTKILFGIDASQADRFLVVGASSGDPAEHLRLALRDFGPPPQHAEIAALDLSEPDSLRSRFCEIAVPWTFLDREPPQAEEPLSLGFKSLICEQDDNPKIGDLVAPATLLARDGKPYEATIRNTRNV